MVNIETQVIINGVSMNFWGDDKGNGDDTSDEIMYVDDDGIDYHENVDNEEHHEHVDDEENCCNDSVICGIKCCSCAL